MKNRILMLIVALAMTAGASNANADLITFDDITTSAGLDAIPNGYKGFDWDLYWVREDYAPVSGYNNGTVSGRYAAFNPFGLSVTVSDGLFNFESAYLTGAWRNGLQVRVQGYLNNVEIYDSTVVTSAYVANQYNFNYSNIDTLVFSSFGGVEVPNWNGSGTHFAMDNFEYTVVPAPGAALLAVTGVALIGAIRRRRRA